MPSQRELTDKEKALMAMGAPDPRENETDPSLIEEEIKNKEIQDKAAEEKAKKEKELAAKKKEEEEKENQKKQNPPQPAPIELSDEQLLAIASKKAGREIKSWEELQLKPIITEEDKKKEQERKDAEKLSYGLQKGLFNRNTYESFISDSKDKINLVKRVELEAAKADDPQWTEEKEKEFNEEFDDRFGLDLDHTSSRYKRGQKQLSAIADNILRSTYASIYNLDDAYGKYEQSVNEEKQQQQKILTIAPVYKQDLDSILDGLKTVEFKMKDDVFAVDVTPEMIQSVNEMLSDKDFVMSQIMAGHSKEKLNEVVMNLVKTQNFNELAFEAAKKYREKHEKGVRGIIETGKLDKGTTEYENLSEQQKKALDIMKDQHAIAN